MIKITSIDQMMKRSRHSKYLYINRRGQEFIRSGVNLKRQFQESCYRNEFFNINSITLLENKEEVERIRYLRELVS